MKKEREKNKWRQNAKFGVICFITNHQIHVFFQKEKNNNKWIIKDVTFFLVVECLNKK